jgi:Sulfotransferase family
MQIKRKKSHSCFALPKLNLLRISNLPYVFAFAGTVMLAYVWLRSSKRRKELSAFGSLHRRPNQKPMRADEELRKNSLQYIRSIKSLNRAKALKFYHIPKTAGTAVEYAAGSANIAWGSCLFNHVPKRDICHYPEKSREWPQHVGWWHVPPHFFPLAGADPYQGAELFAVVRDPYDRMLSEFIYICTLKVFDWRPDQCNRTRLLEPEYMNHWLKSKLSSRAKRPGARQYLADNGHFTPQFDFLVAPNDVRMVDYVLRLGRDLDAEFDALMKAYGLSHLKLKKLNALGAEPRSEQHLSVTDLGKETIEIIHNTYPGDFKLGYEMQETSR